MKPLKDSYSWKWMKGEKKAKFWNYKKLRKFRHYGIFLQVLQEMGGWRSGWGSGFEI